MVEHEKLGIKAPDPGRIPAHDGHHPVNEPPALRAERRRAWNQPVIWPVVAVLALIVAGLVPGVVAYRRRERAAAL